MYYLQSTGEFPKPRKLKKDGMKKRKPPSQPSTSSEEAKANLLMNDLATTSDEDSVCTYQEQQLKLLEKEVKRRQESNEYVPERIHYPPRSGPLIKQ